jgi:hypothetical protein
VRMARATKVRMSNWIVTIERNEGLRNVRRRVTRRSSSRRTSDIQRGFGMDTTSTKHATVRMEAAVVETAVVGH